MTLKPRNENLPAFRHIYNLTFLFIDLNPLRRVCGIGIARLRYLRDGTLNDGWAPASVCRCAMMTGSRAAGLLSRIAEKRTQEDPELLPGLSRC